MNHEKRNSRLGGNAAIAMGVLYLLVGITFFSQPEAQRVSIADGDEALIKFYVSMDKNRIPHTLLHFELGLISLLAFAVVPAITDRVNADRSPFLSWIRNLGLLGYTSFAMYNFRALDGEYSHAQAIATTTGDVQNAIVTSAKLIPIDRIGFLDYWCVGLWLIVINFFAFRANAFPRWLAVVGMGFGIMYWSMFLAYVLERGVFAQVANGLGGILLAPIWLIAIGFTLRRRTRDA